MNPSNGPTEDKLRGAKYVTLVRVSDASQGQDSDEAQLKYLNGWAHQRGMLGVGDFVSNDLTGSLPGNRPDLKALLARADHKGDFQYVIAQRIDRTTRGGADHLFWFEYECKKRGIRVLYPGDGLPEDVPFANSLKAFKADAAKEQSFSTSQRSTQGSQHALEKRQISPHSHTPYGTYRLYCRHDGSPLFVIRDRRDGRQEKLTWPDLALIDTYGTIGGGSKGHYRKQKSEQVYLVPGDPKEVEVVRRIFRMRYGEGRGGRSIAGELNGEGTPAPMGGPWSPRQVESIYENEDYTGVGIANRTSSAFYHRRQSGQPQRVQLDPQILANAQRIQPIVRPIEEWYADAEPYLAAFLGDESLRQTAIVQQRRHWERRLDPTWERKNRTKHPQSPYLLSDLLVAKQDGEKLVGSRSGRPDRPVRIYRHKRAVRECSRGSLYNRIFNAEALESAVLAVLGEILRSWPELEARLLTQVQEQLAMTDQHDDLLRAKRQQREEVKEQLLLYVRMLSPKTKLELGPEIARLEAQRDALDAEIESLQNQQRFEQIDPQAMAKAVRSRLEHLAEEIRTLPPHAVKQVLAALTESLVADMETKEVAFAFHLPSWAIWESKETSLSQVCLRTSREFSAGAQTQRDASLFIPLGQGICRFVQHQRSVSCHCRRSDRPRAA